MNKDEIYRALESLNQKLSQKEHSFNITIVGGASVSLMGVSNKLTKDIDFVSPDKDLDILKTLASETANDLGLSKNWLNDSSKVFRDEFPDKWEERTQCVLEFSHLVVYTLSRQDIISIKLKAHIERGFDFEDLLALSPTEKEFKKAREYCESFPLNEVEKYELKTTIDSILNR